MHLEPDSFLFYFEIIITRLELLHQGLRFVQQFVQAQVKETVQQAWLAFVKWDRWIPLTKDQ